VAGRRCWGRVTGTIIVQLYDVLEWVGVIIEEYVMFAHVRTAFEGSEVLTLSKHIGTHSHDSE
jgi:hypothetical protein